MDVLDLKIIKALQRNGRVKNAELAGKCGIAPSTMLERVRRLEEKGFVKGYHTEFDLKKLGLMIHGFVAVSLKSHNADEIDLFEKKVQNIPYIRACYRVTGRFDYFIHVTTQDLDHYGEIVKTRFAAIPGIGKMETFFVMEEVKKLENWTVSDCLAQ